MSTIATAKTLRKSLRFCMGDSEHWSAIQVGNCLLDPKRARAAREHDQSSSRRGLESGRSRSRNAPRSKGFSRRTGRSRIDRATSPQRTSQQTHITAREFPDPWQQPRATSRLVQRKWTEGKEWGGPAALTSRRSRHALPGAKAPVKQLLAPPAGETEQALLIPARCANEPAKQAWLPGRKHR